MRADGRSRHVRFVTSVTADALHLSVVMQRELDRGDGLQWRQTASTHFGGRVDLPETSRAQDDSRRIILAQDEEFLPNGLLPPRHH
jgi:hypothetical protein